MSFLKKLISKFNKKSNILTRSIKIDQKIDEWWSDNIQEENWPEYQNDIEEWPGIQKEEILYQQESCNFEESFEKFFEESSSSIDDKENFYISSPSIEQENPFIKEKFYISSIKQENSSIKETLINNYYFEWFLLILLLGLMPFSLILSWICGILFLFRWRFLLIKLNLAERDIVKYVDPFEIYY
ncbi:7309_t:CDS:1, partial [Dentiscutata erythropus]